jgi:hypothetical protein
LHGIEEFDRRCQPPASDRVIRRHFRAEDVVFDRFEFGQRDFPEALLEPGVGEKEVVSLFAAYPELGRLRL